VDESTNWKEYISPDGRKWVLVSLMSFSLLFLIFISDFIFNEIFCRYFYNKVTKESKWLIPEELKVSTIASNALSKFFLLFSAFKF